MTTVRSLRLASLLFILLLTPLPVAAQFSSALQGTITDSQQAFVPNATVRVTNVTTGASITAPSNNTNSGWLVGVGIEWAFAPNWSAKFEYDYLGLNSRTFIFPGGGFLAGDTFTISNPNVQTVKVGINYLFNYGVGRY